MANLARRQKLAEDFRDLAMRRVKAVGLEDFRAAVWAMFTELVYTTPQFSGLAAANWNLGIGAPDLSFDRSLGDQDVEVVNNKTRAGVHAVVQSHHTGHDRWASVALDRNKYKLRQITKWGQDIFICNASQGSPETTTGMAQGSSVYYLSALQDPSYWPARLREANQPYETVSQVLLMESWRARLNERRVGLEFIE